MTPYLLSIKFINAKTYSKSDIERRINMFFMFNQLSEAEYQELMTLIAEKYPEEVA